MPINGTSAQAAPEGSGWAEIRRAVTGLTRYEYGPGRPVSQAEMGAWSALAQAAPEAEMEAGQ